MSTTANLTYCDGRGRAEQIRFLLATAGIKFTESFIKTKEDLNKLRASGKLIFGQIPLLEIDSQNITQTTAIIHYIARNYKLNGKNDKDHTKCDMIFDGLKDANSCYIGYCFQEDKEAYKKEKIMPLVEKYYPKFEKILADNGNNGHFVGDEITYVDVIYLHDLTWFVEIFGCDALDKYPNTKKLYETVSAHERVAAFLSGDQRKPHPGADYVADVRAIFY